MRSARRDGLGRHAGRLVARRGRDARPAARPRRALGRDWPRQPGARREPSSSSAGRTIRATRRRGSDFGSRTRRADGERADPRARARGVTGRSDRAGSRPRLGNPRPHRRVGGPARAAAVAHRGPPAGRPDRAAREPRRGLPRSARDDRARSDEQHQLVRGRRQPAHPDQEPGDAPSPAGGPRNDPG